MLESFVTSVSGTGSGIQRTTTVHHVLMKPDNGADTNMPYM